MRSARQQADDLEHAGTFLNAILTSDVEPTKAHPPAKEAAHQRHSNGRSKGSKLDSVTRFADPPAPPPQQPLPQKPDTSKASPVTNTFTNLLKRNDTTKPSHNTAHSPTNPPNSQINNLIQALSIAKEELDSQGARVKQLEEMLKHERQAREDAEERARKLELHATARPVSVVEEQSEPLAAAEQAGQPEIEQSADHGTDNEAEERTRNLQQNLEQVLGEMQRLKSDVDNFQKRAETAEADAAGARQSLAEMIEKLREEDERVEKSPKKSHGRGRAEETGGGIEVDAGLGELGSQSIAKPASHANGHVRTPRLPEHLERAVATVLRERNSDSDTLAQSAPYVSMLGVVLIGVGLMAYLNSWQKSDR
jgi:hypothetical protein